MSLQEKVEELLALYPQKKLKEAVSDLTSRYRSNLSHRSDIHRVAYLATRMPATYAVLKKVFSEIEIPPKILDCGAGPGTSIWALLGHSIRSLTLVEKDKKFVEIGKALFPHPPFSVTWKTESFLNLDLTAELILFSYYIILMRIPGLSSLIGILLSCRSSASVRL